MSRGDMNKWMPEVSENSFTAQTEQTKRIMYFKIER